ncbi:hypothetical protein [Flavivirga aquatica]|nr:hypothetical protein [Flavivirga aquatica]
MLRSIQPYIEYALNQDYIATFLCINKNNPKLQCHGKCHLAKALEKQQESTPNSLRVSLKNYPIGFVTIYKLKKIQEFISVSISYYSYKQLYDFDYNRDAFHPPDIG